MCRKSSLNLDEIAHLFGRQTAYRLALEGREARQTGQRISQRSFWSGLIVTVSPDNQYAAAIQLTSHEFQEQQCGPVCLMEVIEHQQQRRVFGSLLQEPRDCVE